MSNDTTKSDILTSRDGLNEINLRRLISAQALDMAIQHTQRKFDIVCLRIDQENTQMQKLMNEGKVLKDDYKFKIKPEYPSTKELVNDAELLLEYFKKYTKLD